MSVIQRILIPTDFSRDAEQALLHGARLSVDHDAEVVLVHVQPRTGASDAPERLTRARRELEARGVNVADARVIEGAPSREILRIASERGCDLIVMGSHGHESHSPVTLGAIAGEVVDHAGCPVLTVSADAAHRVDLD